MTAPQIKVRQAMHHVKFDYNNKFCMALIFEESFAIHNTVVWRISYCD